MFPRRAIHTPQIPARGKGSRTVPVAVEGGLHSGVASHLMPPGGFSPDLRNFVPTPGFIQPRNGLAQTEVFDFKGAVLGAAQVFDVNGVLGGYASSASSVAFLHPTNTMWSSLSYVPGSQAWHAGNLSGTNNDYFVNEVIYDPVSDTMLNVFSNNTDSLKFFPVASTTTLFSDFTFADSLDSTSLAAGVVSINDRLVLFNTQSSVGTRYPTRVMWSSRGRPKSFLIADGAGFEDLQSMQGKGVASVKFRDFLLLFTEHEIWRAQPTLDDYAFRFTLAVEGHGTPWARTICTTPIGVVWLDHDYEVYITDGFSVAPLGSVGGEGPSRIRRKLQKELLNPARAWMAYNHSTHRIELYYTTTDSAEGFPTRALFYDIAQKSWWPQKFPFELSAGADIPDAATEVTWDDFAPTELWDAYDVMWDSFAIALGSRNFNVWDSNGSVLKFLSTATNDDGTTIDCRWRSPGIRSGDHHKMHLSDIWVDYETDSSSSASIFLGDARSETFDAGRSLNLTTTAAPLHVATWKTDEAPSFEIRVADGGQPRLTLFVATLKDASRF